MSVIKSIKIQNEKVNINDARISDNDITNWNNKTSNVGTVTSITLNSTSYTPVDGAVDIGSLVTTNTDQDITGTKTFIGTKKVAFKQSTTNDKLGFTLYTNTGAEKGYLEFNPTNKIDNAPLMTLGNYASSSDAITHIGFRKYSSVSGANGAYNLLAPLISDAKTPFSLTTTYTNFYLPLGFTDGTTTVQTAKTGLVDISSLLPDISGKAPLVSPAFTGTPTAPTAAAGTDSTQIATTAFVAAAIGALPEPMIFQGSLGTGGTITDLPSASSSNTGYTYKVITAGTYASQAAEIGDTFISDGTSWILIPSGDEPGGTVTSVKIEATSPIVIDDDTAITTSGIKTLSHATSGVTAGTYKSVTVDTYGHVTAGSNPTTLSGYGITDAKIENGVITLGSNSITPLTSHQDLTNYIQKSNTAGLVKNDGTIDTSTYLTSAPVTSVNGQTGAVSLNIPSAPGTLNTTATTAQSTNSSEALSGSVTLHKVAKTGTYSDLIGKPTIPTVNDTTITLQANGSTVDTFTTNASSAKTINLGNTLTSTTAGLKIEVVSALPASPDSNTIYIVQ